MAMVYAVVIIEAGFLYFAMQQAIKHDNSAGEGPVPRRMTLCRSPVWFAMWATMWLATVAMALPLLSVVTVVIHLCVFCGGIVAAARPRFLVLSILALVALVVAVVVATPGPICSINLRIIEPTSLPFCRPPPKGGCPRTYHLVEPTTSGEYELNREAEAYLRSLPGPLHVHSVLGNFDTGKSIMQTVTALLFTQWKEEKGCGQFGVRPRYEHPTTNTRGVWFAAFPVDDIHTEGWNNKDMVRALENLAGSTIILIDTEGFDSVGHDKAVVRRLELLVWASSSVVTFKTKGHVGALDIAALEYAAQLQQLVENKLTGLDECNLDTKFGTTSGDDSGFIHISRPKVMLIPKDGTSLLGSVEGVEMDGAKIRVQSHATMIATKEFWRAVNLTNSRQVLWESFSDADYLVSLPSRETVPAPLSWVCPSNELISLAPPENQPASLPRCWQCGNLCGGGLTNCHATKILPHILRSSKSKIIDNRQANGAALADFISKAIHLDLKQFNFIWSASSIEDIRNETCAMVKKEVHAFMNSFKQRTKALPIENRASGTNEVVCNELHPQHGVYCTQTDFQRWWDQEVAASRRRLCSIASVTPKAMFGDCWAKAGGIEMQELYGKAMDENWAKCKYTWLTHQPGPCEGTCPGARVRDVTCENLAGEDRPQACCDADKPWTQEPCGRWAWSWQHSPWGDCSNATCGTQTRSVWCERCDGTRADDARCDSSTKPLQQQDCNLESAWRHSAWKTCSKLACGTQNRSVWCERCGTRVDNDQCNGPEPASQQPCEVRFRWASSTCDCTTNLRPYYCTNECIKNRTYESLCTGQPPGPDQCSCPNWPRKLVAVIVVAALCVLLAIQKCEKPEKPEKSRWCLFSRKTRKKAA